VAVAPAAACDDAAASATADRDSGSRLGPTAAHMAALTGVHFSTVEVLTWRALATYSLRFFLQLETRRAPAFPRPLPQSERLSGFPALAAGKRLASAS